MVSACAEAYNSTHELLHIETSILVNGMESIRTHSVMCLFSDELQNAPSLEVEW